MSSRSSERLHNRAEVEARLWKELERRRTVMLGITRPSQHLQPMTACHDDDSRSVFFYAKTDNHLATEAGADGRPAMMCLQSKDDDFIACVAGELRVDHDRERIDRFWTPVVAAWFPDGKDDPSLTLLRFDPADAEVWLSEAAPVKFGWEIAKANITKREPDVGERAHLDL